MLNRSSIMVSINRLSPNERAKILHLLCEGNSIRAITRLTGCSKNTITKLLVDAGKACAAYQDKAFRNLSCQRLQVDEIWSFVYAKAKNVPSAKEGEAGSVWTWVAICADTKLVPSWLVASRDADSAIIFMQDLKDRLANRVQLTSDSWLPYLEAVELAFGDDIDYARLVKIYGPGESGDGPKRYSAAQCVGTENRTVAGKPASEYISTSFVERQNLTMRMHMRRFTRLTNAFSKKIENHAYAVALHFMYYNFVRIHKTLRMTPAMAAGVTAKLWDMPDIVKVLEDWEASAS